MNKRIPYHDILIIASLLLTVLAPVGPVLAQAAPVIRYVRQGMTGNCASWTTACGLETALTNPGTVDEIWVAAGVYYPSTAGHANPWEATFQLRDNVAVYGGFYGTETDRSQRDPAAHPTILSGDIDLDGLLDDGNACHVVTGSGTGAAAVLDGFTISGGWAGQSYPNDSAGGMLILSGSPTLANLIFTGNWARYYGGGLFNDSGSPVMTNVTFSGNAGGLGGGAGMYNGSGSPVLTGVTFHNNKETRFGGGLYNDGGSPILTNITFSENSATRYGGGLHSKGNPVLSNVTFRGNSAQYGGGMSISNGSPIMTNVTFSGNSASEWGGGIYSTFGSPSLTNVTFTGNSAEPVAGGLVLESSSASMLNCIVWGNTPASNQIIGSPTITFSDIQGGWSGPGSSNIDADPRLEALADNGGFTLTHALRGGSPAIDAGSPTTCPPADQRGMPRPIDGDLLNGTRCDMGAVEFAPLKRHFPVVFR